LQTNPPVSFFRIIRYNKVKGVNYVQIMEYNVMVAASFRKLHLSSARMVKGFWLIQVVKFATVGMINTGIDLGVFLLITRYVSFFGDYLFLSKAFSYCMGVITSYTLNRRWTFDSEMSSKRTFLPFFAVNLFSVVINASLLTLLIRYMRFNEIVAIALVTAITFAWNFLASKILVFRDTAFDHDVRTESYNREDDKNGKTLLQLYRHEL
jgi:putative flippase GtrA